jgi:hypothetical protein
VARRHGLGVDEFVEWFVAGNRPVIVEDAMEGWPAVGLWTPRLFCERFGGEHVQVYDDLFKLVNIQTLSAFCSRHIDGELPLASGVVPYVRWYSRLRDSDELPWADVAFSQLAGEWSMPNFLPGSGYLLPHRCARERADVTTGWFPFRGIYISPPGARTRLHRDPWRSDAVLCQFYGTKDVTLYPPTEIGHVVDGDDFVDPDDLDADRFPRFGDARPCPTERLRPGEVLYLPHDWAHHVTTSTTSISITWNFVHSATWPDHFEFLAGAAQPKDFDDMRLFVAGSVVNAGSGGSGGS